MDIGLHLLGGRVHGFWSEPREAQVDLLAYWQVMQDKDAAFRWRSMAPVRLADLAVHGVRTGWLEVVSGLRAWLGASGVRFKSATERGIEAAAERRLHEMNAERVGASAKAKAFWLGGG